MSWNNVIPAELLVGSTTITREQVENPVVSMPEELITDCLIRYEFEGAYGVIAAHADHPCFAELRKVLAARGYIKIPEYTCWNGDRVIKRFRFNDFQLEPGDTFYCAAAWAVRLAVRTKKGIIA
jgi:hypothetical protein